MTDTLPETLSEFTRELIQDLKDLRAGRITAGAARVRAQLAREVLRAVHLQLEGLKYLSDGAKAAGGKRALGQSAAKKPGNT